MLSCRVGKTSMLPHVIIVYAATWHVSYLDLELGLSLGFDLELELELELGELSLICHGFQLHMPVDVCV